MKSDLSIDRRKDDLPLRRRKVIYALEGQELCLWKKRRSIHLSSNGKNLTQLLQHSHHWEEEISIPFGLLQSFPVIKYKSIKTMLSFPVGNEHAVFLLATQVGNRKVIHLSFDWILDFFFLKKKHYLCLSYGCFLQCPSEKHTQDPRRRCRLTGPSPSTPRWSPPCQPRLSLAARWTSHCRNLCNLAAVVIQRKLLKQGRKWSFAIFWQTDRTKHYLFPFESPQIGERRSILI